MRSFLALAFLLPATVAAAGPKLTLDQVIAKALAGPKVQMANHDIDAAAGRLSEADAARYPRVKGTSFITASPVINCIDPQCTITDPQNFAFKFDGVFGSAQLDVTQPLWTFGKISHARKAARAGVEAQRALADEAAGDLAVDAARAYWGVKLAREMRYMLEDGVDEIQKAIDRMNERTGTDAPTIQDRQRIIVLLNEAKAQRADAAMTEGQALAGLRALTGIRDADVDDEPIVALERALPKAATGEGRPQWRAAKQGAVAADELAAMAKAQYYPDIALVGSAIFSGAQGVTDPPGVFAYDLYNRQGAGVVLGLQWTIEPWNVHARHAKAKAEASRAHAQSELAALGARYDAETALSEATQARAKLEASVEGEKAGRAWVAAVLQLDAIGGAESRDLADAYLGWFGMRAKWAQAVFQWNVALVRLGRSEGEFRARR